MTTRFIAPTLPERVTKKSPMRAEWANNVVDSLKAIIGPQSSGGLRENTFNLYQWMPFHIEMKSEAVAIVSAGTVHQQAVPDVDIAETEVTLTGSVEYLFVQIDRITRAGTIEHASTKPTGDSTYIQLVLCKLIGQETGSAEDDTLTTVYSIELPIYHFGDFYFDTPTQ